MARPRDVKNYLASALPKMAFCSVQIFYLTLWWLEMKSRVSKIGHNYIGIKQYNSQ